MASDGSYFPSALSHVSDSEADDDRRNPLGVVVAPTSSDEEGGGLPSNQGGALLRQSRTWSWRKSRTVSGNCGPHGGL